MKLLTAVLAGADMLYVCLAVPNEINSLVGRSDRSDVDVLVPDSASWRAQHLVAGDANETILHRWQSPHTGSGAYGCLVSPTVQSAASLINAALLIFIAHDRHRHIVRTSTRTLTTLTTTTTTTKATSRFCIALAVTTGICVGEFVRRLKCSSPSKNSNV